MEFNSLYNSHNFHDWHKYLPVEKHYANFEAYIIYSLQKVDDVYYAFANARYNASMTENKEYTNLISNGEENSLKMVKSNFLMNALNFYNFAIDLSWQVLFFYTSDNSLYFLSDPKAYDKYSNLCNYKTLVNRLKYRNENVLLQILTDFYNNPLFRELRELYNYLKHRGTLYFEGLGEQYDTPYMTVQVGEVDITYKMFVRRETSIEDLKSKLLNFDILFYEYFNKILNWIVPKNYLEVRGSLEDVLNVSLEVRNFKEINLGQYANLFNQFYFE